MAHVREDERGDGPPILTLLGAIDEHRAAFEYDWRTRFGCRLDVPGGMSYGEAWRLTTALANEPSSHVGAALAGWDFPVSREWLIAADHYDLVVAMNAKKGRKPKPYPRPWGDTDRKRYGRATRPQSEILAALAARGHGVPT